MPEETDATGGPAPPAGDAPQPAYPMAPASVFRRLYAAFIDAGLVMALFALLHIVTDGRVAARDAAPQDIFILLAYFVLFTGIRGQTPGKMVAGIIVVNAEGHVPGVGVAIPREMVGKAVSIAAGGLGLAWIAFDSRRQGWHDKIAGTYVVVKVRLPLADGSAATSRRPGEASPRRARSRSRRGRRGRR